MEKTKEKKEYILFKNVSLVDKYNFYEYISVMVDWGVSLIEALESVNSKISSLFFKEKITEMITYISSWDSFSKSMKKIPSVFLSSEVSIIESWETTGELSKSLMRLSDELKKNHELRNKIKWSLTYPIIIFLFLFLALNIVLIYVIPNIKPLFADADVALPVATQALIAVSDFVRNNIWVLIFFFCFVFVLFVWYKNTKSWRQSIEAFIISTPLIWRVYKNYILANIASTLGSLIGSWVSVVKTLTLVWKSTNNSIYMWLFDEIVLKVSSWESIVQSMEDLDPEKKYFPADYLQMLSVWERTASIEKISEKISAQYEKEVTHSLNAMTKWIEPIAILLAWVFVLWFAFAIFWAILKVTQVVS